MAAAASKGASKGVKDPRLKPYHLLPPDKGPQMQIFRLTLDEDVFNSLKRAGDVSFRMGEDGQHILRVGKQEHELEKQTYTAVEDCLCMKDGVVQCLGTVSRRLAKKGDSKAAKAQLEKGLSTMTQQRERQRATIRQERPDEKEKTRKRKIEDDSPAPAKHSSSPLEAKEVGKDELKTRIIHALALQDLTLEQVSKQCLRENEKEGQGAKVVVICKEVADWGKGVSCGASKTYRLKGEALKEVSAGWYASSSLSASGLGAKQQQEVVKLRKSLFDAPEKHRISAIKDDAELEQRRNEYKALHAEYMSEHKKWEDWHTYFQTHWKKVKAATKESKASTEKIIQKHSEKKLDLLENQTKFLRLHDQLQTLLTVIENYSDSRSQSQGWGAGR